MSIVYGVGEEKEGYFEKFSETFFERWRKQLKTGKKPDKKIKGHTGYFFQKI